MFEFLQPHLELYNQKIQIMNLFIDGLVKSSVNSIIISGGPGLGKSYNVTERLRHHEENSGIRFKINKGHLTPLSMYELMVDNCGPENILVFDDCDDVIYNPLALNLLKAASELTPNRKISWNGRASVPECQFSAKCIVITNVVLRNHEHLDAALDRMHVYNLQVPFMERLAKIVDIASHTLKQYRDECDPSDVVEHLIAVQDKLNHNKFTLRTFEKLYQLKMLFKNEWKNSIDIMGALHYKEEDEE